MRLLPLALLALVACGDDATGDPAPTTTSSGTGGNGGAAPAMPEVGPVAGPCPAGELDDEGRCLPAGVGLCATGFSSGNEGGCRAVLPAAPCAAGTMAIPGDTQCRPVATCGVAPWGDIPVEPTTQYVDATFDGASDGSATAPWTTVQAAIDAASDGALVAIAPGTYSENLLINGKALRLHGLCPDAVTLTSPNADSPTLYLFDADGSEVATVAITGAGRGLLVAESQGVVLDRLRLHDTGEEGLYVTNLGEAAPTDVTLRDSLVENAAEQGVQGIGAVLTIERSAIVGTLPHPGSGQFGRGVDIRPDDDLTVTATLSLVDSVVERSHEFAVLANGTTTTIERSVIRQTHPNPIGSDTGMGFAAARDEATGFDATLAMTDSELGDHHTCGLCFFDGQALIERTTLRDTKVGNLSGHGVILGAIQPDGEPSAEIRHCVIRDNEGAGVEISDIPTLLSATIVRDTRSLPPGAMFAGRGGFGVQVIASASGPSSATLEGCLIADNEAIGVAAIGGDLLLQSTLVRGTQGAANGFYGWGVSAEASEDGFAGAAQLEGCLVEDNREAGAVTFGATLQATDSVFRNTLPNIAEEGSGYGVASLADPSTAAPSELTLARCRLGGNASGGLLVAGASAMVTASHVLESESSMGLYGDGILVAPGIPGADGELVTAASQLDLGASVIENNARAGLYVLDASASLQDNWLACNPIALNGDGDYTLDDAGGNQCLCDGMFDECKVLTESLEVPSAPTNPLL